MMAGFSTYTASGAAFITAFLAAVQIIPGPEQYFMTVHSISYDGGMVTAERTIDGTARGELGQPIIADWRVTVVGPDAETPSCQTVPGKRVGQGWSRYTPGPRQNSTMHLDTWVGDSGCLDRLSPGDYSMFVTWTPRDGSQPVWAKTTFTK